MSASPDSLAVALPAAVLGPSVGVTPRCPRVRFQAWKAMALFPAPWSDSTRSMVASIATLRSSPSNQTLCSSHVPWMITLSTSGSVMALPSSSYLVTILTTLLGPKAGTTGGLAWRGTAACGATGTMGWLAREVEAWEVEACGVALVVGGWRGVLGTAPVAVVGREVEADEVEGVGWLPPPWPLRPASGIDLLSLLFMLRLLCLLLFPFLLFTLCKFEFLGFWFVLWG